MTKDFIYSQAGTLLEETPNRCVIVIDRELPNGRAANAVAVIALTIGARHPVFVGEPLIEKSGINHPGLIPVGITILCSSQNELPKIRAKGLEIGCDVVDFPVEGQLTKNYEIFRNAVANLETSSMRYLGVALIGQKKQISKIVEDYSLY
jgi:hypothetical protein